MPKRNKKLYQKVADQIVASIRSGEHPPGSRLPSERDLAAAYEVSRPTVREAIIALEIRGWVSARHGAGVFVSSAFPADAGGPELDIGPFELIEARRLFEGEAAALAAGAITDKELARLEELIDVMAKNRDSEIGEKADGEFHVAIAEATRNTVIANVIENLWELRFRSPLCVNIFARGREGGVRQPVGDHREILNALRRRDPKAARAAMHAHLDNVVEKVLEATETDAMERARLEVAAKREEVLKRSKYYQPPKEEAAPEGV